MASLPLPLPLPLPEPRRRLPAMTAPVPGRHPLAYPPVSVTALGRLTEDPCATNLT